MELRTCSENPLQNDKKKWSHEQLAQVCISSHQLWNPNDRFSTEPKNSFRYIKYPEIDWEKNMRNDNWSVSLLFLFVSEKMQKLGTNIYSVVCILARRSTYMAKENINWHEITMYNVKYINEKIYHYIHIHSQNNATWLGENWIFIQRFWECGRILSFKNGYKLDLFP